MYYMIKKSNKFLKGFTSQEPKTPVFAERKSLCKKYDTYQEAENDKNKIKDICKIIQCK